jgi:hypothetical protein
VQVTNREKVKAIVDQLTSNELPTPIRVMCYHKPECDSIDEHMHRLKSPASVSPIEAPPKMTSAHVRSFAEFRHDSTPYSSHLLDIERLVSQLASGHSRNVAMREIDEAIAILEVGESAAGSGARDACLKVRAMLERWRLPNA